MGETATGEAQPADDGATTHAEAHLGDDLVRIAESVHGVVDARACLISRVVDDQWLEVVAVVGEPSAGIVEGLRWERADLGSLLAGGQQLGRLHATKHRTVSYVEVPGDVPETERYIAHHLGLLIAPLHALDGELVGVLTTEGPVDIGHPPPGACELVELYADQARLALAALRQHDTMTERLRVSDAGQGVLEAAAAAEDLPALVSTLAAGVAEMMRAGGALVCTELEPGVGSEAAAYPAEVGTRLGGDVCALLEPMITTCLRDRTVLTHDSAPVLQRLASGAGFGQAVVAAIGGGPSTRGALLVLRDAEDDAWSEADRESLLVLGRRLGAIADRVRERHRDHETVRELRRLDDYRRDLVASITHDLKTPLAAISLNTELLESDGRLAEAGSHPVTAIRRSADRLADLLDDLLAMARVEEGVGTVSRVDLVELLRSACEHAESEARLREVTFEIEAPEELWAAVDHSALGRVFANLVANAVKFSLPRGSVRLRLSRSAGAVELRCADEGIGIPPERLAALFDVSRRAPDARTGDLPGAGIGLVICQRIVTRMGGRITAESVQGQGSTFTVRLPVD